VDIVFSAGFAALLGACAVGLMFWHVKSWRAQQASDLEAKELDYHRRQFRRRMQSSALGLILVASIPIGMWIIPRWPKIAAMYWGGVLLLVVWIVMLAAADIWATKYFFGKLRDSFQIERAKLEAELRRAQAMQAEARRSQDEPGNGKPPRG
jgi:hypothetical protein